VLPETNAQIENFDDTISAVVVAEFERGSKRSGLRRPSRTSETVSAVVIKEMWNE
jgi:hypothetical protein